jgi:hypothetical protein
MELEGNEKNKNKQNNSCPVSGFFVTLKSCFIWKSWVTSLQPRPPALTQSATTPLTSEAMVSSDMFWPFFYHMYSPFTKKKPCHYSK